MRRLLVLVASIACLSCSSSDEPARAESSPYVPPPARAVVEPGILREILEIEGVAPEPNPALAAATPAERNVVRVVRYRPDSSPPKPARAIVVMMPGFLGGAGSFDPLARALVRRGLDDPDGAIEAWAIDRRSNLLEDTHGDDVAEVRGDPDLARRYYFDGDEVEGKRFAGFVDPSEIPYASEWGAATTLGDLRRVIARVPAAERRSRVVLLGHSMGATLAEAYAAWDFGGARGFDELAALVLVDGVAGREGDPATSFVEGEYLEGAPAPGGPFGQTGLTAIRKGQVYVSLPLLGVSVLEHAERMAIATARAPSAIRVAHDDLTTSLSILLGLGRDALPKMTNAAAFGLAFDDASSAISIAAVSAGAATGGPLAQYEGLLGSRLLQPSDPSATYAWRGFDEVAPPERTRLADLARSWFEGPGLNFGEWYFPTRLALDAGFVGDLTIADDDWRAAYGLRAKHGRALDLPVLGFAAALVADPVAGSSAPTASRFDKLRALLAPNPIGEGRPLAGVARSDPRAFQVIVRPQFTHIDPLQAADVGEGKAWFDELGVFVRTHTPAGGVVIEP